MRRDRRERSLGRTDLAELAAVARELEHEPPASVIGWAWERFGSDVVVSASFQDCVLIDLVSKAAPDIEVVFLDTHFHFAETLSFIDRVRERYDLNLRVMEPLVPRDELYKTDPDECCARRKLEPLARAVRDKRAWITGLRRTETPARANVPIVHLDVGRGIVKVNPLASWSDDVVAAYKEDNALLEHPLSSLGYASIGCWPCTRPVAPGDDPRSGRWAGMDKTECGLHDAGNARLC